MPACPPASLRLLLPALLAATGFAGPETALFAEPPAAGEIAQQTAEQPKVSTRIYLSGDKLVAGSTVPFAVKATIAEGWHVNAQPPSQEYLIPITVSVKSTHGTKLVDMLYPQGAGHDSGVGQIAIYEGEVYLFGTIEVPQTVGQTEELVFETSYQTCSDANECLPPAKSKITGKIAIVAPGTPVKPMNAQIFQRREQIKLSGTLIKAETLR